jgi:hypothetical protein
MPHYFMRLIDNTEAISDPDGIEMALEEVAGAALRAARDCMAGDVKSGIRDFHYRMDVHDETGDMVHSLSFRDALKVFGL